MNNIWSSLNIQPPDTLVEVMDENGNIAQAYPTYYPFKVGKGIPGRKWSAPIIPCDPYWDGGWLITCKLLTTDIDSNIVKWRLI